MRVLVTGGRDFIDVPWLWNVLDDHQPISVIIEGASDEVTGPYKGADYWANQWALANEVQAIRQPALWRLHGKAAGPIRNEYMITAHKPDLVIAFPGGNGTAHMVKMAAKYKVACKVLAKDSPWVDYPVHKSYEVPGTGI